MEQFINELTLAVLYTMGINLIILIVAFTVLSILLYLMHRNNQTYITLMVINNELQYKLQMVNSKEDVEHISSVLKKLTQKDRYSRMIFSFKSFTQLDYELRKEIGML